MSAREPRSSSSAARLPSPHPGRCSSRWSRRSWILLVVPLRVDRRGGCSFCWRDSRPGGSRAGSHVAVLQPGSVQLRATGLVEIRLRIFQSNPFGVGLGRVQILLVRDPVARSEGAFAKLREVRHDGAQRVPGSAHRAGFSRGWSSSCWSCWFHCGSAVRGFGGSVPEDRRWSRGRARPGLLLSGIHAMFNFNFHEIGLVVTRRLILGILAHLLAWIRPGRRFALPRSSRGCRVFVVLLAAAIRCSPSRWRPWRKSRYMRGEALVRAKEYPSGGEDVPCGHRSWIRSATRIRMRWPLWSTGCTLPESGREPDPVAVESLLTESIRWEAKAGYSEPEGFPEDFPYRLADLFVDRYGVGGERRDLEATVRLRQDASSRSTRTASRSSGTGPGFLILDARRGRGRGDPAGRIRSNRTSAGAMLNLPS